MNQNKNDDKNLESQELLKCQKESREYLDNWKRERADFINYKNNEMKRLADFALMASEGLLLEFLELKDDLEAMADHHPGDQALVAVLRKFSSILKKNNVSKMEIENKKFDPQLHEAIEVTDPGGVKMMEVRAGYMIGDKVLRPARVRIVK